MEWGDTGPFNDSGCGGVKAGYGYTLESNNCLMEHPFLCDFPLGKDTNTFSNISNNKRIVHMSVRLLICMSLDNVMG